MSEERKLSVWPCIAALLIGLPVLYVASFGPACWATSWTKCGNQSLATVYRPILWISDQSWNRVGRYIDEYARAGAAPGWCWLGDEWGWYGPAARAINRNLGVAD